MFSNECIAKASQFSAQQGQTPHSSTNVFAETPRPLGLLERLYQKLPNGTRT
jgi:hypothetical protein